jgi:hypothetical protein
MLNELDKSIQAQMLAVQTQFEAEWERVQTPHDIRNGFCFKELQGNGSFDACHTYQIRGRQKYRLTLCFVPHAHVPTLWWMTVWHKRSGNDRPEVKDAQRRCQTLCDNGRQS